MKDSNQSNEFLTVRCQECLFYKKIPKSSNSKCCFEEGVRGFSVAPSSCYQPDYTQINFSMNQFLSLSSLLSSLDSHQARIAISILINSYKTKNRKFPFGSKVYIRNGEDYLNNYLSCFVVGYLGKDTVVVSGQPDKKLAGNNFIGYLYTSSCLNATEWEAKRADLIKKGLINDPNANKSIGEKVYKYEAPTPTIDETPKEWRATNVSRKRLDSYEKLTQNIL